MRQILRGCLTVHKLCPQHYSRRDYTSAPGSCSPPSSAIDISMPCYAPIPNRAFVSITGPEPNLSTFLNGILSNQVTPIVGEPIGFYTTFLNRHGRIFYDAFFHPHPDTHPSETGYIIEYDPRPLPSELIRDPGVEKAPIPALPTLLKRFVLRSKVRVRDVSDEWEAWSIWGGEAERQAERRREKVWMGWKWGGSSAAVEPTWLGRRTPDVRLSSSDQADDMLPFEQGRGTGSWDWRAPGMGRRILIPKTEKPFVPEEYALGTVFDYARHRIMNGVPEGSVDMAEAIPFERNVDIMGGVDFRKGCYVGQENVVRTYHTGMIRKRTIPVQLSSPSSVKDLSAPSAKDENHLDPAPPRLSDISLRLTPAGVAAAAHSPLRAPRRTTNGAPDFVRAKGKLLSRAGDWALAQIRMEHLEAHERGEMTMYIPPVEGGSPTMLDRAWDVTPRVPAWWPRISKSHTEDASSTEADSSTSGGA